MKLTGRRQNHIHDFLQICQCVNFRQNSLLHKQGHGILLRDLEPNGSALRSNFYIPGLAVTSTVHPVESIP